MKKIEDGEKNSHHHFSQLIGWSLESFHALPWRVNRTPYSTLVSEMMLQQTTVATVSVRFVQFMKKFPSLKHLAKASEADVLEAWQGLGYYRRARLLLQAAQTMHKEHGGIPDELECLIEIPGIGAYSSCALRAIGHDKPALALDANLERVLARWLKLEQTKGKDLHLEIQKHFDHGKLTFLKQFSPRALNEALMDLGRETCKARAADCEKCPLQSSCQTFKTGDMLLYPRQSEKLSQKKNKYTVTLLRLVLPAAKGLFAIQRTSGQWLENQWELPTFILESPKELEHQYPVWQGGTPPAKLVTFKSTITNHIFTNLVWCLNADEISQWNKTQQRWWKKNHALWTIHKGSLSSASQKAFEKA